MLQGEVDLKQTGPAVTDARDAQRARGASRSRPTFSAAGSRPTRGSASPRPRRATASARRRCARRCRGSPRAASSTRSGKRGFRVTPISRADLADIVLIRSVIEREALRLAWRAAAPTGRATSSRALHRLKRGVAQDPRGFREGDAGFDALHKAFHAALISACGSPRLIAAQSQLYDEAYRYRRLMMAFVPLRRRNSSTSHERLAELVDRARRRGGGGGARPRISPRRWRSSIPSAAP